jgi:hypothetical protein
MRFKISSTIDNAISKALSQSDLDSKLRRDLKDSLNQSIITFSTITSLSEYLREKNKDDDNYYKHQLLKDAQFHFEPMVPRKSAFADSIPLGAYEDRKKDEGKIRGLSEAAEVTKATSAIINCLFSVVGCAVAIFYYSSHLTQDVITVSPREYFNDIV